MSAHTNSRHFSSFWWLSLSNVTNKNSQIVAHTRRVFCQNEEYWKLIYYSIFSIFFPCRSFHLFDTNILLRMSPRNTSRTRWGCRFTRKSSFSLNIIWHMIGHYRARKNKKMWLLTTIRRWGKKPSAEYIIWWLVRVSSKIYFAHILLITGKRFHEDIRLFQEVMLIKK